MSALDTLHGWRCSHASVETEQGFYADGIRAGGLVTTHDGKKDNIMTISWTMVMDFTPVFAITTGEWNHSFAALRKNRECVIAIPTVDLLDKVVGIGTCSGADTDKFARFKLTPVPAKSSGRP